MTKTMTLVNGIGLRKLKSLPFLDAQPAHPLGAVTTPEVRIRASIAILPATH